MAPSSFRGRAMRDALLLFCSFLLALLLTKVAMSWGWVSGRWPARCVLLICLLLVVPVFFRRAREESRTRRERDFSRTKAKTVGVLFCSVGMLIYAAVICRIDTGVADEFVFDFLLLFPLLLAILLAYQWWADGYETPADGEYLKFGALLLGKSGCRWQECSKFLLPWAVKIFFLPIMYTGFMESVGYLLTLEAQANPVSILAGMFAFGLAFDLLIGTLGYMLASPFLGTSVIGVDDSWDGWLVCIICYSPLLILYRMVSQQVDNVIWSQWLSPDSLLFWVWACVIALTWIMYWVSNACFGLRFSNLCWRGLVDGGPYALMKHPAYFFKNVYWWFNTVPFIGVAFGLDMLRNFLALSFVSLVYYLRAKTEERHLSRYPEYAEYCERIARDGLLGRLRRVGLRFVSA